MCLQRLFEATLRLEGKDALTMEKRFEAITARLPFVHRYKEVTRVVFVPDTDVRRKTSFQVVPGEQVLEALRP